jgi:hypothetical protein
MESTKLLQVLLFVALDQVSTWGCLPGVFPRPIGNLPSCKGLQCLKVAEQKPKIAFQVSSAFLDFALAPRKQRPLSLPPERAPGACTLLSLLAKGLRTSRCLNADSKYGLKIQMKAVSGGPQEEPSQKASAANKAANGARLLRLRQDESRRMITILPLSQLKLVQPKRLVDDTPWRIQRPGYGGFKGMGGAAPCTKKIIMRGILAVSARSLVS